MASQPISHEPTKVISIFFCCAYDVYRDKVLLNELKKHLSSLKQEGRILYRYGRMISPGRETIHEIDHYLNTSDVILLMVSPDFINSDYIYNIQIQRALERHKAGEARVIPIILRPVDWKDTPFGMLQPLPTDGKPITTWSSQDAALLNVTNGIRQVIDELTTNTSIDKSSLSEKELTVHENLPALFSQATLIDASLDPHDSPYKQSIENGEKTIRYKNHDVEQEIGQINIEQITEQDHMYYHRYKYRFPTIDFKFQNTGTATAFLWQFAINVHHAEIDLTPTFDFCIQIEDGALEIIATNNGWGEAQNCHFYVEESTLSRLFNDLDRTTIETIPGGEQRKIFSFTKASANQDQFESIVKEFTDVIHHYPKTIRAIKLETLTVKWACDDIKGMGHEGKEHIQSFDGMGEYVLTYDGFFKNDNWRAGGGARSELTYGTKINSLEGPHEQYYPMSRQIPPGDIERFHIMVGSSMSCHILIQFKIFVDKAKIIESEIFKVDIWNPRNSGWHYGYKDGEELRRDIEKEQNLINSGRLSTDSKEAEQSVLESLQRLASNYPFIKNLRQIRRWLLD